MKKFFGKKKTHTAKAGVASLPPVVEEGLGNNTQSHHGYSSSRDFNSCAQQQPFNKHKEPPISLDPPGAFGWSNDCSSYSESNAVYFSKSGNVSKHTGYNLSENMEGVYQSIKSIDIHKEELNTSDSLKLSGRSIPQSPSLNRVHRRMSDRPSPYSKDYLHENHRFNFEQKEPDTGVSQDSWAGRKSSSITSNISVENPRISPTGITRPQNSRPVDRNSYPRKPNNDIQITDRSQFHPPSMTPLESRGASSILIGSETFAHANIQSACSMLNMNKDNDVDSSSDSNTDVGKQFPKRAHSYQAGMFDNTSIEDTSTISKSANTLTKKNKTVKFYETMVSVLGEYSLDMKEYFSRKIEKEMEKQNKKLEKQLSKSLENISKGIDFLCENTESAEYSPDNQFLEYIWYKVISRIAEIVSSEDANTKKEKKKKKKEKHVAIELKYDQLFNKLYADMSSNFKAAEKMEITKCTTNDKAAIMECLMRWKMYFRSKTDKHKVLIEILESIGFTDIQEELSGIVEKNRTFTRKKQIVAIDDPSLRRVSGQLGYNWKKLGTFLGFSLQEMETFEMETKPVSEAIFKMLVQWRDNTNGSNQIQVGMFCAALIQAGFTNIASSLQ